MRHGYKVVLRAFGDLEPLHVVLRTVIRDTDNTDLESSRVRTLNDTLVLVVAALENSGCKQHSEWLLVKKLDVPVHTVMVANVSEDRARVLRVDIGHPAHKSM